MDRCFGLGARRMKGIQGMEIERIMDEGETIAITVTLHIKKKGSVGRS